MELQQATMGMSKQVNGKEKRTMHLVSLWKKVGLCIHRNVDVKEIKYNISHFNSGKSVLRLVKSKAKAEEYLQRIYDEVMPDWRFTLEEWEQFASDEKAILKKKLDEMQKEIL